jgi:hypothetical protein
MHVYGQSSSDQESKMKSQNKEGLPRDSPSIVFAAAVAFTGRPPQRRPGSSYKAPAYDNETLDHLLSIVENKVSLLANQPSLQAEFSPQARIGGVNFSLSFVRRLDLCVGARGMPV